MYYYIITTTFDFTKVSYFFLWPDDHCDLANQFSFSRNALSISTFLTSKLCLFFDLC